MFCIYGRFLSINNTAIAIAIMIATTLTVMYIIKSLVVAKPICTACGVDVAVAGKLALKYVEEDDG